MSIGPPGTPKLLLIIPCIHKILNPLVYHPMKSKLLLDMQTSGTVSGKKFWEDRCCEAAEEGECVWKAKYQGFLAAANTQLWLTAVSSLGSEVSRRTGAPHSETERAK